MRHRRLFTALVCLASLVFSTGPARAQTTADAEIREPSTGQALDGLVTVLGTAANPSFAGYRLEFAYDPNPTADWFPITKRIETEVVDGRLAVWDTNALPAGRYQLRLTVFRDQADPLVATVSGLTIGESAVDQQPAVIPTSPADAQSFEQMQPAGTTGARVPARDADVPLSADQTMVRLLGLGAAFAAGLLALLAAYSGLRPRVRDYTGRLRMRRVHRRLARRRRKER